MINQKNKIYISSDHAGFERKEAIKQFLTSQHYQVEDLGPSQFDPSDDYPDYAFVLAQRVAQQEGQGIIICGNGQGVCIAANKVKGIRAASAFSAEMAQTTRLDDDANILCLPGRFLSDQEIEHIVSAWLNSDFSGAERHRRRIDKINQFESRRQ